MPIIFTSRGFLMRKCIIVIIIKIHSDHFEERITIDSIPIYIQNMFYKFKLPSVNRLRNPSHLMLIFKL